MGQAVDWKRLTIAVVGGDRREQEIARLAATTGATVRAYGFPWPEGGIEDVAYTASAAAAMDGAHVALFPIPGMSASGSLFAPAAPEPIVPDRALLERLVAPAHIILGWANDALKGHCQALGITLHEYEWDVELMLLRGPAIVEGLLGAIIANTERTIHKSRICVVGQGTIGFLVARTLIALGARTFVAARNPVQRAAAYAAGAETMEIGEIKTIAGQLDCIVSSVPHQIIGRDVLSLLPRHALLVDLAAPPGGIDRDIAKELGLKFVWARGMGSRAPVTVGASQWSGIKKRIETIYGANP